MADGSLNGERMARKRKRTSRSTVLAVAHALKDTVPGRAQRGKLLEALARVKGNQPWRDLVAALQTELTEPSTSPAVPSPSSPPPSVPAAGCAGMRAALIPYSRGTAEVDLRMDQREAAEVLRQLDDLAGVLPAVIQAGPLGRLQGVLRGVLPKERGSHAA